MSALPANPDHAVVTFNTPRIFPKIATLEQWQQRAHTIREQVLISSGLWPLPQKTPVCARVFGKIERDGYSIEKVFFQTYPGFFLAGNLYRPARHGLGPFPAILNPHGHFSTGRMTDTRDNSTAARCIGFARRGMIAFSYDMVGYNDSRFPDAAPDRDFHQAHVTFGTNRTDQLWSISLLGLQTWNSIRALDFLESLPDVDAKRLACTGESGGATQVCMLGAVDDRLTAQAPVVMVSHSMQGGCACENAPGLRIEYSNPEIAAAAAPRPQILVAATGDWTRTTLEVEGPALDKIYALCGAPERLRCVRFDSGHNYNQTSREAVYGWFDRWLLRHSEAGPAHEQPYAKEPDALLRVFPDNLPAAALSEKQLAQELKQIHQSQWNALLPGNKDDFANFTRQISPAWRHVMQLESPESTAITHDRLDKNQCTISHLDFKHPGEPEKLSALLFEPIRQRTDHSGRSLTVVLAGPDPLPGCLDRDGNPRGLIRKLLTKGCRVLAINRFSSGAIQDQFGSFFTTYNRTFLQNRVRDLAGVCGQCRSLTPGKPSRVVLWGMGPAGTWSLLAAPAADAVVADAAQLPVLEDDAILSPELFCPGIRTIGTLEGAAMLAAPNPLLLHNTGENYPIKGIQSAYQSIGALKKIRIESQPVSEESVLKWLLNL